MYDDDTGAPEVVACGATTRRSRRPRTCEGCGDAINPGEVYERRAYKVDGEMTTADLHRGH